MTSPDFELAMKWLRDAYISEPKDFTNETQYYRFVTANMRRAYLALKSHQRNTTQEQRP